MAEDLEEDFEDEEGSAETEHAARPSSDRIKKILLIVVLPLLVLGGAAAAYFTGAADPLLRMVGGGGEEKKAHGEPAKGGGHGKDGGPGKDGPAEAVTVFHDMPDMLVNLNTAGRRQTFLKIRVSLVLTDAADVARVERAMPRIIDNFQVFLRERKVEDLQGAKGMEELREKLLERARVAAAPAKVDGILFKEMLVQ
jgi:flagellar FliL protein